MAEFNEDDRMEMDLNECQICMKNGTVKLVQPCFYKNDTKRKCMVRFIDPVDKATHDFEINNMWMYSTITFDPTAACFGCYVPGVPGNAILLKFHSESDLHDFIKSFNKCINFKQRDIRDRIEQRFQFHIPKIDTRNFDDDDMDKADVPFDEREVQSFLKTKAMPKMHFDVFDNDHSETLNHYAWRVGLGASAEDFHNFFAAHLNDAKRAHWRECPEVTNGIPTRQSCDPILDAANYQFREQVHQPARLEVPDVERSERALRLAEEDPIL